jgi:hypothetical protein
MQGVARLLCDLSVLGWLAALEPKSFALCDELGSMGGMMN